MVNPAIPRRSRVLLGYGLTAWLLGPFQQRINTIIQGMRAEGNYALIFDADAQNNGIVAADLALDLTAKVIARVRQAGP